MNQIASCNWLRIRERARYDGAIPLAKWPPFCSRNNISRKSKKVNESFLLQNIFRDSKNIFYDFFVEMELEQTRKLKHCNFIDQASSIKMAGH